MGRIGRLYVLIYTHGWLTLAVRVRVRLRTKEGGVDRGISE
ncbi:MAG: hypothetical protein RXQ95_09490 [Vulcanisaeta sp.]